ncbi:MAG: DUF1345 domain-containing protein [Ktedonobacteraceae bacterium]|nr:DUF1345 domain-containing protein [Ktedonobacteraceae bacterium]
MRQTDQVDRADQASQPASTNTPEQPEEASQLVAHWLPALVGALVLGLLFALLPENITIGPSWIPLIFIAGALLPTLIAKATRRHLPHITSRIFSFILLGIITTVLIAGVTLMIVTLPSKTEHEAGLLLREAGLLWLSNILVFAFWYWEIDGGGPRKRHESGHQAADFLFPQQAAPIPGKENEVWIPQFLDYLFVAFTGATALSPTDTYPLSRRAKMLMMIEALIALGITIVIIGRAVNIL